MPQAPPSPGRERGASGCGSQLHGPAPKGTNYVFPHEEHVSTKQFPRLEHRAKPETQDLEMIPGHLLSPSHVLQSLLHTLSPNLPLRTFLSASDSLSARVSLRLQSALPFLPGDVSSHGQHLSDPQIMSFIPSLILCKFLGNSNPAETSGRVPGTGHRNIQCPSPSAPEPLELFPIQLNEQMMQFLSDPCVR